MGNVMAKAVASIRRWSTLGWYWIWRSLPAQPWLATQWQRRGGCGAGPRHATDRRSMMSMLQVGVLSLAAGERLQQAPVAPTALEFAPALGNPHSWRHRAAASRSRTCIPVIAGCPGDPGRPGPSRLTIRRVWASEDAQDRGRLHGACRAADLSLRAVDRDGVTRRARRRMESLALTCRIRKASRSPSTGRRVDPRARLCTRRFRATRHRSRERPASSCSSAAQGHAVGLDTLVVDGCQDPGTWQRFATTEAEAFKALGANAVGLTFPIYTTSATSNRIFGRRTCGPDSQYHTPSTTRLGVIVDADQPPASPFSCDHSLIRRSSRSRARQVGEATSPRRVLRRGSRTTRTHCCHTSSSLSSIAWRDLRSRRNSEVWLRSLSGATSSRPQGRSTAVIWSSHFPGYIERPKSIRSTRRQGWIPTRSSTTSATPQTQARSAPLGSSAPYDRPPSMDRQRR